MADLAVDCCVQPGCNGTADRIPGLVAPRQKDRPLRLLDAFRNTLAFLYYQIFISSGLSEWSARYFQFEEKQAKEKCGYHPGCTDEQVDRSALSERHSSLARAHPPSRRASRQVAGCTFLPACRTLDLLSCLARKTSDRFGRKMEGQDIGICCTAWRTDLPFLPVLLFSALKVALDTIALTLLIHPSASFDVNTFQQLYPLFASFHVLAGFLPSLGPADGILRGAAGSFYFIGEPVQMKMAAASIFLLWTINVALPGSVGGLLQL